MADVCNLIWIKDKQILGFPKLLSMDILSTQVEDIISPMCMCIFANILCSLDGVKFSKALHLASCLVQKHDNFHMYFWKTYLKFST